MLKGVEHPLALAEGVLGGASIPELVMKGLASLGGGGLIFVYALGVDAVAFVVGLHFVFAPVDGLLG